MGSDHKAKLCGPCFTTLTPIASSVVLGIPLLKPYGEHTHDSGQDRVEQTCPARQGGIHDNLKMDDTILHYLMKHTPLDAAASSLPLIRSPVTVMPPQVSSTM